MTLCVSDYIAALDKPLGTLAFKETLAVIDSHYDFKATQFDNGPVSNPAGTNSGSCKVFSFAGLHGLSEAQTLRMFAEHYQNVLETPEGDTHGNIRAFMKTGFDGLEFDGPALRVK